MTHIDHRETALSVALSVPICAICADFVRVPSPVLVHMYIGPRTDCSPLPALTTNRIRGAIWL